MKYKTTVTLCRLLAVFCLLMPATAQALSLDLAVSISQPSLKVKSASNNAVLGTLVSKTALWPSVALKTKEHYFGDSKFGYTAEMMPGTCGWTGRKWAARRSTWVPRPGAILPT